MDTNWVLDYVARWHDTWDVIGAFATFVAVVLALVGFAFEAVRARRADARAEAAEAGRAADRAAADAERAAADAERLERERRAQALLVVAYPMWRKGQGSTAKSWRVQFGNYSTAPVFDVTICAYDPAGEVIVEEELPVLVPDSFSEIGTGRMHERLDPQVVIYFRDLAGVRWKRLQTGALVEVDEHRRPL